MAMLDDPDIDNQLSDVGRYYATSSQQARLALTAAQEDDPEKAARALTLSDATGVPSTAIYGDLDGFEKSNKAQMGSAIVSDNAYIADYLNSHPMAPRVSHDDLGQLDTTSLRISNLFPDSRLGKWLKDDSIAQTFMEGFGSQPIGSANLRPDEIDWALSHPAAASIGMAINTPMELVSRSIGGLMRLGHEGVSQVFGESWANEVQAMAEWAIMRGDMHVSEAPSIIKADVDGIATKTHVAKMGPFDALAANQKLLDGIRNTARGLELSDPWTAIGREPPPGIHPLIDDAKSIQAKEDIDGLDEALKESQKSATRDRSPELFANFIRSHIGDREIGIDSEAIRGLYGDKTPESGDGVLGWVPDLDKKLAAAELTGEDVRVPVADWLANVDPEIAKALHDDIRVRDGGLTINETKIKAEPKEAIADPVAMLRGSAGFEPQFMAGDRKISLQRMDVERAKEVFGDQSLEEKEPVEDHDILDENGKSIGTISVSQRGKDLYIHNIQAGPEHADFYQPRYLGPSLIRDLKRQLKQAYPEAENVTGYRVTGARDAAGAVDRLPLAKVRLNVPEGWGQVEGFRDLLNNFWQPMEKGISAEGLRGEKTLDEQVLAEAIRRELDRITPAKVGSVDTPISIRRRTDAPKLGGFHQKFYDDFPKIAVALDGAGSPAVEVARHEAIHHLRSYGFFSDREWATLEKAAKDNGWLDKYKINARYPKLDLPSKLEESIAEGYRHWARGERASPELHPIFEKLKQLFEAIKTHFKELTGRDLDWDEIFKKVDTGEIGSREGTEALADRGRKPFDLKAMIEEPEGDEPSFGIYDRGKALGVTQAHMDRMLSLIEKRNAEDLDAANRRAELRQRRRSNKEFKERRTVLRDEVSNDLQSRPDIALDRLLSKQKVKFNPAYLSEDQRARLPKDYLQTKNGINPDDLAPYFGYTSGDAMVERLGMYTEDRRRSGLSARDHFNRLVDVETDRRLNQEFGDREQNILDEAKDQALSETQLNLVHEETLAYALKAHGPDYVPQFTKEQVREMVRGVFNDTPIGQISSDRLIQNAGKIGKKIEEAGAKGDWATAYRLSQQRNHTMIAAKFARDYEKARASFDRTAKTFRKREVASVPQEYTNWIHSILLSVERPINRSVQGLAENIGRQGEQTLRDFAEAKEAEWMGMRELPIADFLLDPNFHKNLSDLTHDQFMGLKNSVDALAKAGRDERKIYREGEAYDRETVIGEMRDKLATFDYKPTNVEPSRLGKWPRAFFYGLTNMETLLNRWDRSDPRGVFNRMVVYPLADAANGKARLQREIAAAYAKLSKPTDLEKLVDAPITDPMTRTPANPDGSGTWERFNRGNVLAMLQNAGNKSNWKVLAKGYGADEEALRQWLFRNTTKEDWDRAQQMGDTIFKSLVAKADNVYERMTGATIEKIPLEPIDTPYGQYKGWYHPLIEDPQRKTVWVQDPDTGLWQQKAQGKRERIDDSDFFHFSTANGYTKRRTGAIYPLDLNFNMVPTRVKQMIHDISFREVIHDTQKIFGDRRFREDVAKHYGAEYADGLVPYLRAVAGSEGISSKGLAAASQLSEYLRQNVISTYIGFNPFTVLKHGPTAAVMSSKEVGPGSFFNAVKTLYGQAPSVSRITHDFIMKNSEEIQRRERHWQDTIAGQGREITGAGNLREKVIEAGSAAVAWSDMVSAKPTWLAAYNKSISDGLSHGESVSLADRAVRRAHGSTAETNQPPLVRGGGPLHSWLTSVYGFFGTAMQRRIETAHKLSDAWDLGQSRQINAATKKLGSAFADMMTYMIWPTIVEEAVTGIGSDDHRTWGSRLISGATMGAASSVLYLRDLIHGAISGHEPGVGMLSSALHDVANVFRDVGRGTQALNRQHAGKTVGDLLTVAGESTGMAPKIVGNAARYGINVAAGQEKPKSIADVLLGVTKGTQKRRVEK